MYCLTCNLHYAEQMKFCKRCGLPLARVEAEPKVEGGRCTRCGARIVAGNKFCQQCGVHLTARVEETTIGTCHNCGIFWRSSWLYCKNCGMARDNALFSPDTQSAIPTIFTDIYQPRQDVSNSVAELHCHYCGTEVRTGSRFCEACGGKLRATPTGKLSPLTVEHRSLASPGEMVSVSGGASRLSGLGEDQELASRLSAPAEQPWVEETEAAELIELGQSNQSASEAHPALLENEDQASALSVEEGQTIQLGQAEQAGDLRQEAEHCKAAVATSARSGTVVTKIIPEFVEASAVLYESEQHNRHTIWSGAIFGIALLLTLLAGAIVYLRTLPEPPEGAAFEASPNRESLLSSPGQLPAQPTPPEGMVYVPGGTFQMGRNDEDEYSRPAHIVTVPPFFIDRTEVTNEQYWVFVQQTGHRAPAHWKNGQIPAGAERLPVVNVSWGDASAYARWAGKRLPTEEEWEFAARGADGRIYPWGQQWQPELANIAESKRNRLVEVGSYAAGASPFGVLDMCGNAWEWTANDLYSYAELGKIIGPGKVIRGGAYDVSRKRATTTYRGFVHPDKGYEKTGFRCVRDIKP